MTGVKKTTKKAVEKPGSAKIGKNGPNMPYLKNMAKQLNVAGYSKMAKPELIHAIQLAESNSDCYQRVLDCGLRECLFYMPCQLP